MSEKPKIRQNTWLHFQLLAMHKKAEMSPEQMIQLCIDNGVPFDDYAATLQLQLDIIDAFDTFRATRSTEELYAAMRSCVGAAANAAAFMSHEAPIYGEDAAAIIINDVVAIFADMFSRRTAWVPETMVKQPTHESNRTIN